MVRTWKRWTESDEQVILDNPQMTYAEIAHRLGRTENAVQVRACRLGVLRRRKWTSQEDAFLRDMAAQKTCREIAECLDRPSGTVSNQASLLGIKFTSYTENYNGDKAYFNFWMVEEHMARLRELAPEHAGGNVSRMTRQIITLGLEAFDKVDN